jgi:hypothetical protein
MRNRRPYALRKRLAEKVRAQKLAERAQAPLHWFAKHEQEREAIEEARREAEQRERDRG